MTTARNSWVLITGASSGFGEEVARLYAGKGHSLVLVARRLDGLEKLGDEIRQKYGVAVLAEQVDASDAAAAIRFHEQLRERGIAIKIMVNNAGHGLEGALLDNPLDAALAMAQLDIASLIAVTRFLRET